MSTPAPSPPAPFWTRTVDEICTELRCTPGGLSSAAALERLREHGPNADAAVRAPGLAGAVLRRLLEPLSLILLAAAIVSTATGDTVGGSIILAILALSIGVDTVQEGQAVKAAEALRHSVALHAEVSRDGKYVEISVEDVVPGDLIRVRSGDIIPADAIVLEESSFTTNEAALTGEAYPASKRPGVAPSPEAGEAFNAVFRGAIALTGEAVALVVNTGRDTVFGAAATALSEPTELSPFEKDLHAFALLIARLTIALVLVVLATHVFFGRPVLQSLLFAVALAVGLTPELLPMITTVTLSRGALRMARRKVIVKRLVSIHDLGAMTVLCTDKTGTLTSAEIVMARSLDPSGAENPIPARLAAAAAILGGDRGSLDTALAEHAPDAARGWTLLARLSFDFTRRMGSILAETPDGRLLVVKGAPEAIVEQCRQMRTANGAQPMNTADRAAALVLVTTLAGDGMRTVAIASKACSTDADKVTAADEADLTFEGLCAFADPPKASAAQAIARLAELGIQVKILSGDDPVVVKRLAGLVGMEAESVPSGAEVAGLSDDALAVQVKSISAFGRLAPDQKSRIIRALQAGGAVVGYLGDGINDAPALRMASIGLSVSGATGVAQAAADMILLESDLGVVADGVDEGRRTFANILKYVRMGASSNFGNMLSMAGASLFLPFLPMLPTQILLNNLLYDFSEIGIPFDTVSKAAVSRPQVWDIRSLMVFAAVMGGLSSCFDLLTFAGLLLLFHAAPAEFQTAWFLESMATQILVVFIIRTNLRPWQNMPHPLLIASSVGVLVVAVALPFSPAGQWFGFVPPPLGLTICLMLVVALYLVCAETTKAWLVGALARQALRRRVGRAHATHQPT